MTPEEREREDARLFRMIEREDRYGSECTTGGAILAGMFPVPNTDGMSADDREAILARWRAEVWAFCDGIGKVTSAAPQPAPAPAAPEVPAT